MSIPRDERWDTNNETWDEPFDSSTAVPAEDNAFHEQFSNAGLLKFQQKAAAPMYQTRCICGTPLDVHVCATKADDVQTKHDDKGTRYYSRLEELMTKHSVKWAKLEDGPGFQIKGSKNMGKACKLGLKEFLTDKQPTDESKKANGGPSDRKAKVPERSGGAIYTA